MKISIVATAVFSLAASAAANIVLPADETPATRDATTNRLIEMAMADDNKELLDHLNAFSVLKEDALVKDQRRRLHGGDDAAPHGRKLSKSSSKQECFYGFATEAFTYDWPQSDTYTWEDSTLPPTGRIYWWGTNAICDDESTNAIGLLQLLQPIRSGLPEEEVWWVVRRSRKSHWTCFVVLPRRCRHPAGRCHSVCWRSSPFQPVHLARSLGWRDRRQKRA